MHFHSINGFESEYVQINDRGLQYGDGLFETILYSKGRLELWDRHYQRLCQSAQRLSIIVPSSEIFLSDIEAAISKIHADEVVIKLILTRGSSERGYSYGKGQIPTRVLLASEHTKSLPKTGIKMTVCRHTISVNRSLAGMKHLNRLDNVLARSEWDDDFHEGVMTDGDSNVIEGTMSNLFIVKDGAIVTPDLSVAGVEGVFRSVVIDQAEKLKIPLEVKQIKLDELSAADEIFISNSINHIVPVTSLAGATFNVGPIYERLNEHLNEMIESESKAIH